MVKLIEKGVYLVNGKTFVQNDGNAISEIAKLGKFSESQVNDAYKGTMAYSILNNHNCNGKQAQKGEGLNVKFDALASHDITYVGIVQTAKASGLDKFPIPYVLTNCHNSLCAVGGTINEDDHVFGLSAAKKYGGIYVPAHIAVIHQFMRETMAGCGKMILGSDSHTRYGALGTMAIGEGGPELVKQILSKTYDIQYPNVVAVELKGKVKKGVGPQDVALAIIGATFKNGFVKNKVLEFVGEGIKNLSVDFRNGIDVMTTETTCLSSIWITDDKTKQYFETFGRKQEFKALSPDCLAYYDSAIVVDLDKIEPMIAMPFHPSNVYKISDVVKNPYDILSAVEKDVKSQLENPNIDYKLTDKIVNGAVMVEQGVIAGCAGGTYENIVEASKILDKKSIGQDEFTLSVYPSSQPVYSSLIDNGAISKLMNCGAVVKTAFCGPCFGAGDVPANNAFSIRHTTRNFPSREGSKPGQGQIASVALMDARSIAATARNGGKLTPATEIDYDNCIEKYQYNSEIYKNRIFMGYEKAEPKEELKYGPNIADWPEQISLTDNVMLKVVSAIFDPVTTTDELIPSGETSSYRSNPLKLAEFTLSRKDPKYVGRAKDNKAVELLRRQGKIDEANKLDESYANAMKYASKEFGATESNTALGSVVYAIKPGDGSAREQAASCQRVLGGLANICTEYATKRYRSNLINWGMLPFIIDSKDFAVDDYVFIPNIKKQLAEGKLEFDAMLMRGENLKEQKKIVLKMDKLTDDEKDIILKGCLINYYAQ